MSNELATRLIHLPADTWVLTETVWQARALQEQLAAAQQAAGAQVWERPTILPWDSAWPLLWDRLPGELPQRITALQERSLWRQVIQRAAGKEDWLLDAERSARLAQQARRLLLQWRVSGQDPFAEGALSEEAQHFHAWHAGYQAALAERHVVDSAGLSEALAALDPSALPVFLLPQTVLTYGVDLQIPARARLSAQLQRCGVVLDVLPLWTPPAEAVRSARQHACAQAEEERLVAAQWLRAQFEDAQEGSGQRWLWVVPDLVQAQAVIGRVLAQTLQPQRWLTLAGDGAPLWRLSVPRRLLDAPAIQALLRLLRMGRGEIATQDFGVLLRSPWWVVAEEREAALALDLRLRKQGEPQMTLAAAIAQSASCPLLQQTLQALKEGPAAVQGVLSSALWADRLERFVREGFWARLLREAAESVAESAVESVAESADKDAEANAQAVHDLAALRLHDLAALRLRELTELRDGWNQALDALAGLQVVEDAQGYGGMLSSLHRCLEGVSLPEPVSEAAIWVLTPDEARGLPAEGVWVSGLREGRWPAAARMHPMLPAGWARSLPLYAVAQRVQRARAQFAEWQRMGGVLSWPKLEGEEELAPLAWLHELQPLDPADGLPMPALTALLRAQAPCETRYESATRLSGGRLQGGAGAFKHQSLCPFRGFVRNRLGTRSLDEAHGGLDARERGVVLHEALRVFWASFAEDERTQEALRALSEAACALRVEAAVQQALQDIARDRALTLSGRFLQHEEQRLRAALQQLIALDRAETRTSFTVIELEDRRAVEFAGLQLHVQRDRVDALADGRRILLDYKTGSVQAAHWKGERPKDPQLPLYAVLEADAGEGIASVAFAQLRKGQWQFLGEVAEAGLLPGIPAARKKPIDFAEQIPQWRAALQVLAAEIHAGVATVTPQKGACEYCGLQAVCRVSAWQMDEDEASEGMTSNGTPDEVVA